MKQIKQRAWALIFLLCLGQCSFISLLCLLGSLLCCCLGICRSL